MQKPIWALIKNKLELASTTANSICSHRGFLGLKLIWQNQLAHHFTELTIRMNRQEVLEETTRLRIKEGQLQSKNITCIISEFYKSNKVVPKHNLAFKVIHEANKIGLRISRIAENTDRLNITGTEISELLERKEAHSFRTTDKLNLFVLE